MRTQLTDEHDLVESNAGPARQAQVPQRRSGLRGRRGIWLAIAAVAVAVVAVIGAVALFDDDSGSEAAAGPPMELSLGGEAMASCLPFDVNLLATMSPAFAGTVTQVDGDVVTLGVDRWYAGGDAATVQLTAMSGAEALIAGFPLEVGSQYLITAAQGVVNFCGYSGPATPELTTAFDAAFPAAG